MPDNSTAPLWVRMLVKPRTRLLGILAWGAVSAMLFFVLRISSSHAVQVTSWPTTLSLVVLGAIAALLPVMAMLVASQFRRVGMALCAGGTIAGIALLAWYDSTVCFDRAGRPLCYYEIVQGRLRTTHDGGGNRRAPYTRAVVDSITAAVPAPKVVTLGSRTGADSVPIPPPSGGPHVESPPPPPERRPPRPAGAPPPPPGPQPEPPTIQVAVVLEGEVDLLRSALEGRWSVPEIDRVPPNGGIEHRLIVSLRVDTLPAVYGQPRTSVTLHWRKVESTTSRIVGFGAIDNLVANALDRASATGRAIRIAVDTMLARIGRQRLVAF
jgi:hypothetical protein